ncbi:MAG TPA: TRAP transporter small permease subunit [Alphaproteobacteria bacterium]
MHGFVRFVDGLSVVCAVVASILLTGAVLVVTWMVIIRALGYSSYWEIEFAVYLMVAAVFLGSPYCLKTNGHVSVDLLPTLLPAGSARTVVAVVSVVGLIVCLYLTYVGAELTLHSWATGETSGSLWAPPRWPMFIMMPLGLGLTALQYVAELVRLRNQSPGSEP